MSITKCVDCERKIDIDIEEAIYGNDGQCLCEDCWDAVVYEEQKEESIEYQRAFRVYEEISNGDCAYYKNADFGDIPQEHFDEMGRNWDESDIETHINLGFIDAGYEWVEVDWKTHDGNPMKDMSLIKEKK